MDTQQFPATLSSLRQMLQWILKQIIHLPIEKIELQKIELTSEEVLVNIINHGYKDTSQGKIKICVSIEDQDTIILQFWDKGPKFDPLSEERSFDLQASLEQRDVGGLGLMLIKKYMDEVFYERKDDTNILTLKKKLNYS